LLAGEQSANRLQSVSSGLHMKKDNTGDDVGSGVAADPSTKRRTTTNLCRQDSSNNTPQSRLQQPSNGLCLLRSNSIILQQRSSDSQPSIASLHATFSRDQPMTGIPPPLPQLYQEVARKREEARRMQAEQTLIQRARLIEETCGSVNIKDCRLKSARSQL